MALMKKRSVAWVVFAICVVFSLLFSGGRALFDKRNDTTAVFFDKGVEGDGLCIKRDVIQRGECAYNLAGVAANYPAVDKALVTAAQSASTQVSEARSIPEFRQANDACQRAVEDLYTVLSNMSLSEKDRSFALKQYDEFQSRGSAISRDGFNEKARTFNHDRNQFPANLLAQLTGVKEVDLF